MSSKNATTLYIGVTSSLYWRVLQHKNEEGAIFTTKYKCTKLVYFESFTNIEEAIKREKVLKKWNRQWKIDLIKKMNPLMKDLTEKVKDFI